MGLSFIGVDSLDENELSKLTFYSEKFYNKLLRYSKEKDPLVVLHVKKMKTGGKRCKYSVHGRLEGPSLLASATYNDWDFVKTLNTIFKKIETEIEQKFKTEGKKERVSYKHSKNFEEE